MDKRKHRLYLKSTCLFTCNSCHTHLLEQNAIISRNFQGRVSGVRMFKGYNTYFKYRTVLPIL